MVFVGFEHLTHFQAQNNPAKIVLTLPKTSVSLENRLAVKVSCLRNLANLGWRSFAKYVQLYTVHIKFDLTRKFWDIFSGLVLTRDGKVSTLILEGKYSRELPDTQFDVLFANHEGIEAVLCDLDGDLGGRRGLFSLVYLQLNNKHNHFWPKSAGGAGKEVWQW